MAAANWTPVSAPGTNLVDIYGIDDGLSSTFSGGTTTVQGLRVGSAAKEHPIRRNSFRPINDDGRVAGGDWHYTDSTVGRETRERHPFGGDYNKNTVVDAADYPIWRDTLGSTSDLRADGDDNGTIEQADYDFWRASFGNVGQGRRNHYDRQLHLEGQWSADWRTHKGAAFDWPGCRRRH